MGRGDRIGIFRTWTGTLLGIKPLIKLRVVEVRVLERPRSRARATRRLLEIMRQRVGTARVIANVMKVGAPAGARDLLSEIKSQFSCSKGFLNQFSPVMGAHTGPRLLGVGFYHDTADHHPNGSREPDSK